MQEAVRRAVGGIYLDVMASPQTLRVVTQGRRLPQARTGASLRESEQGITFPLRTICDLDQKATKWNKFASSLIARTLLRRKGLDLSGAELELAERSLRWALAEAGRYGEQIDEIGYLAQESTAGKELRDAATKPKPVTLWEVAEHKLKWNELSTSAVEGHGYALRAWAKIIKKNSLEDITTQNLNSFLEHLVTQGWNGKALSPESANGMATTIASPKPARSARASSIRAR